MRSDNNWLVPMLHWSEEVTKTSKVLHVHNYMFDATKSMVYACHLDLLYEGHFHAETSALYITVQESDSVRVSSSDIKDADSSTYPMCNNSVLCTPYHNSNLHYSTHKENIIIINIYHDRGIWLVTQ